MSCREIRERLSEYLDGHLPPAEREEVAEHLRGCVPCRRLQRDLEALRERTGEIDPGVPPRRDLWPEIAARIGAAGARPETPRAAERSFGGWLVAAAAVLAVGLLVPALVDRIGVGESAQSVQRQLDRMSYEALVAEASIARIEDGVLQPRLDLAEVLAARRDLLDEETMATLETEAARLERAIGEIHVALEEQPESRQLKHLLAARYRQERDLLQRISRV